MIEFSPHTYSDHLSLSAYPDFHKDSLALTELSQKEAQTQARFEQERRNLQDVQRQIKPYRDRLNAVRRFAGFAAQQFTNALQLDENNIEAHLGLAVSSLFVGHVNEAVKHFRIVAQAQPGNADAGQWLRYAEAAAGTIA